MKSECKLSVRYYETDLMGVVHHSNYLRYFETGRTEMMIQLGMPIEEVEKLGVMLPVAASECRYKLPAKMGDVLRIVSTVNKVPAAKLIIDTEIYNQKDELLCTGSVTLGFIDAVTRRPVRCPQPLVEVFERNINI
ncbi:MAG: acyl-CoA thioesterase [Bacteroidales bacterium]|nr:acyl-CoA thioesterase [Bacteroidales bacterium]